MKYLCLLIAFIFLLLPVGENANAICPGNWGAILGSYRSVTAYSNGSDPYCDCCPGTYGDQYQCVEFVKRFFGEAMNFSSTSWHGNADTYYGAAETKGLRVFDQGGAIRPEKNDILCFSGGGPQGVGHVGIIYDVGSNFIDLIDQNRSSSDATIRLSLTENNGNYTVGSFSGSYHVQGWLRGYTCDYDHRTPGDDVIYLAPGQEHQFKVYYGNTSRPNAPHWKNDGGDHSIELRSCNDSGDEVSSFLRPVPGRPNWLDPTERKRIVRMTQSDLGTDGIAEFTFWARPPSGVSSGLRHIYFRPYHNSGEWIEQWESMNFPIFVDADAPSVPNPIANPNVCVPTNSFTFNWNPSSDGGGSGVQEYHWKVNEDAETVTRATSVGPLTAPHEGNNTFSVRAIDQVGNASAYGTVIFCWQPTTGPNLSFEQGPPPPNGIPDGWTVLNLNGAGYELGSGDAADGTRYVRFVHTDGNDWSAIGRPHSGLIAPGTTYRLSFWYRTNSTSGFGWRIALSDITSGSQNIIGGPVGAPLADNAWHRFWGAPFSVDAGTLAAYPNIAFYYDYGAIGTVDIDGVVIEPVQLCQ